MRRLPPAPLLGAVLALAFTGCSSPVVVSASADSHDARHGIVGLAYALPKAQAEVVAERKHVRAADVDAAKAAASAAQTLLAAVAKRLAEASEQARALAKLHEAAQEPAKAELLKQLTLAQASVAVLTVDSAAAKQAAEDAARRARLLEDKLDEPLITVSIRFLPSVPDPDAQLVASWEKSIARDDDVKLGVVNGMLSSVDLTSTDQTAAILVSLAQGVAAFASGMALRPAAADKSLDARSARGASCPDFRESMRFDPTDAVAVCRAHQAIERASRGALEVRAGYGSWGGPACSAAAAALPALPRAAEPGSGLYYRAPRQVTLAVGPAAGFDPSAAEAGCAAAAAGGVAGSDPVTAATAVVPDARRLFRLPVEAGTFAKATHKLTFKDGMPQEMYFASPSQLAAAASLPLNIAKAILEVPGSLIKLRVDYDTKAAESVKQQAELLRQQLELLKAQRALDAAVTGP